MWFARSETQALSTTAIGEAIASFVGSAREQGGVEMMRTTAEAEK